VSQTVGLSDHLIQVLDINNVQLIKPEKFIMHLHNAPWYVMDIFDDFDDKWQFLKSCLLYVLTQHAPLKKVVLKYSK